MKVKCAGTVSSCNQIKFTLVNTKLIVTHLVSVVLHCNYQIESS